MRPVPTPTSNTRGEAGSTAINELATAAEYLGRVAAGFVIDIGDAIEGDQFLIAHLAQLDFQTKAGWSSSPDSSSSSSTISYGRRTKSQTTIRLTSSLPALDSG